ncbi:SGNH/GDSL hydrolase family protein [Streptosporangium roseum]|uniref:GDSL-like lipase/acylhydrolase family protein n=1 Tax=Streptosporangium roseum (strain ATCC 12428 / DSM 43021 / JCM 3005 / KCTC 9067 / NCIMB 10171 / NRRL 2505 / NI 9100) TaxID=479432 RepID=D2AQL6_STRRD|nr:SGNH/GDSL hydrolase family protein [Streptosporangium roseum]ACZ84560.1 GDSL-like lipase/acylhydrolase family protein [Streptosporangium roseum DSM 43021]
MHVVPRRLLSILAPALATLLAGSGVAFAAIPAPAAATARGWSASWTASPQRPGANYTPNWSEQGFANQTIRQVVRVSVGGVAVRVRLSNAYGSTPLKVTGATIARTANGAAIRPGSLRHLTVKRARSFTIPAGAELASDAVPLPLGALDSVTVTFYLAAPTGPATYHAQALATSYRSAGDHRADSGATAFAQTSQSWYYLSGVDVIGAPRRDGVVAFGDSLTDGYGARPEADNRYPDELAERLAAAGRARAVLNQGISGNRVTVDSEWLGDKATSRFRRDVLSQPGVGAVVILEGINDIGMSEAPSPMGAPPTEVSAQELIAAHRDLIRQARAGGLRVIGATLPPMKGSRYYNARSEIKRDEVNAWIRTSGEYDAVADLDRALASPADEDQLDPAYDSGDHLHLNDAGYRATAHAIDPADLD